MSNRPESRPRLGVGTVVFRGDEVLLVRRARPPLMGQWSIPGGKVEYGERLEAAALREVREETGVEARVFAEIGVFEAVPDASRSAPHFVMIDFAAEWIAGETRAGDDAAEAEFASLETAVARLAWDQTRRALDRALEARARHKNAAVLAEARGR
ncbi:MAG: NUDIX hydrolase [Parvularculaceae bacterium]